MKKIIYSVLILVLFSVSVLYSFSSRRPEKLSAGQNSSAGSPVISNKTEEVSTRPPAILSAAAALDASLADLSEKYHVTGVSLAAFQNGEVLYQYHYGYRDLQKKIKCGSNTKYRIASLSKTFSAISVMHLVDSGKIELDRDVGDYLGYFVRSSRYPEVPITMRMLLTHTSSLYDCPLYMQSRSGSFTSNKSILARSSAYTGEKPGTKYCYANFNLSLAGAVVESVTKCHFSTYARENIFLPMGIDCAYLADELTDRDDIANCYWSGQGLLRTREMMLRQKHQYAVGELQEHAQGSLMASAEGYARGMMMLLNEGKSVDGNRILTEKSAREITTVQFTDGDIRAALCMREWELIVPGRTLLCHSGDAFGILSAYAVDPVSGTGVVVIANGADRLEDEQTKYPAACLAMIRNAYQYL